MTKVPKMKKLIFALTLVAIMLTSACAIQKSNNAGRINGTDISYTDFVASHRGHFNNFMAEKGRTPDAEEKKEILRNTWRNITIHVILKKQFEKYDITVTQQEVIDSLIANVPSYLYTSPLLTVNGRFDRSLYLQSLEYDTPVNLLPIKQHYLEYIIPIQKLKMELIKNTMLTRREARLIGDIYSSKANIDWVVFDSKETKVNISDNEIQSFYQNNLQRFGQEKATKLDFALVGVELRPEDYNLTITLVDSIYTALSKGADFAALAEKFSVSESSLRGGSLGFVRLTELSEATLNQINNLKNGEITPPLQFDDHWKIYQVLDRTRSMVRLSEIVIRPTPGQLTIDSYYGRAKSLMELGISYGLREAAYEIDASFHTTSIMHQDSLWINDLEVVNQIGSRLVRARPGSILEPVYSHKLSAWVVVQVVQNQTRQYKNLSEVKEQIVKDLEDSKRLQVTDQIARQWLLFNPKPAAALSNPQAFKIHSTPSIGIGDTLFNLPVEYLLYQVIKDHRDKQIRTHVFGDLVLIPIVNNVNTTKNQIVEPGKILELYMKTLSSDWFDQWLEAQIKSASIRIWQ